MPKVSVIIPVYNTEKFLRKCLDSVLNQTFADYEIICVNDCSPDNSQEILNEYAEKYPGKITVSVNEQNRGLGSTRNVGIGISQGEYLMFIDSDDHVKADFIETYYNHMQAEACDVIVGGYIRDVEGKYTEHPVLDSVWSVVTYPIACAKMFRKEFLIKHQIKFSELRFGEDILFSLFLFSAGIRYKVINYSGYYYYLNNESITGAKSSTKNYEQFVMDIYDYYMNSEAYKNLSDEQYRIVEYSYLAQMANALITFGGKVGTKKMAEKYAAFKADILKR
ncbi:MAG: glycosyltransferase family 2 protein, partial [Parasporobacterium sp.]|nr:glycosyltransferase family 2 protein [Parasporobacterium sp.]